MCADQASLIRKTIEGLESIVPLLGEKDKSDLQKHQMPIYDALKQFASQLDAIARGDAQAPTFQAAWSQLFSPDLQRLVQKDILRQASTDDFIADPRSRLVNAKLELVAGLAQLLESGGNMNFQQFVSAWKNNRLRNDAFVKLAQTVKEAGDEFDRASLSFWQKVASGIPFIGKQFAKGHELDDVERFANQVLSARWDPAALSDLVKIYENTTEIRERLDTELREHWPVDEKRSKEIAQEMLDVMWERVHGLLGSDAGEAPRFKGTAELRSDEKGSFYWVSGEIDGGKGNKGKLEIRVDPYGIVDLDSIKGLDLGEAVLKRFAAAAVEKTIAGAEAKRVELIGGQGDDYRFDVRTKAGDHYSVAVSPDGFARMDSIEERRA
jgi:hypothetical protein